MKATPSKKNLENSVAVSVTDTGAGANTAVVRTIAADANEIWVALELDFAFDVDPAAGTELKIESGGNTIFTTYVTSGGPGPIRFPWGCHRNTKNEALVVTLAAAAGATGKLSLRYA